MVILRAFILSLILARLGMAGTDADSRCVRTPPTSGSLPSKVRSCANRRTIESKVTYGQYLLQIYRDPEFEACLEVLQNGKLVYASESTRFVIGRNFYKGVSIPVGTEIAGNGQPDALVTEWTGGAHCCFVTHLFELGKAFREVATVDAEHSDGAGFTDPHGDGHYVFEGNDWAFAYWRTSFMHSPAPRIVLSFADGGLHLDFAAMKKPAPSSDEYAAIVQSVKSDEEWDSRETTNCDQYCNVPVALWRNMLELTYTGHADVAWRLVDDSWPATHKGKRAFVREFCNQFHASHYWKELASEVGTCGGQPR